MDFSNKKVLVCGMALSGISAAKLLNKRGAAVTIQDLKDIDKFDKLKDELDELEAAGITLSFGKNPDDSIERQDLVIVSPGIRSDLPFLEKAKKHSIPVWSEIELAARVCPCPIVAVTGTNGKTSTTALVGEIFKRRFENAEIVGNIGIPFTAKVNQLTEDDFAIAEISSFQLETTYSLKPLVSAVLNVTPDHLDRHKTINNYIAAKERIFGAQDSGDYTVLNYDDDSCRDMAERTKGQVIFFSRKNQLNHGVFLRGSMIVVKGFGIDEEIIDANEINIFVENALAGVAIALCAQIPLEMIKEGLANFKAIEHRIEYVTEINGVQYFNDSKATNPDSAIKALEAMRRPVVLIGGGYNKESDFSEWVKMFEGKVKHLIVLGEVSDKIIDTCLVYNYNKYDKVNSLKNAVEVAAAKATTGDCVLLSPACGSWDMFDNYEQRGRLFKEFVNEMRS